MLNIKLLLIILIISLICLFIFDQNSQTKKEGFYSYYGHYKQYCPTCGWRSRNTCTKCRNCGWCITNDGRGECVPGNHWGPYYRQDCMYWEYGDPYYYHNSNALIIPKKTDIYPNYRYNIRKGRWGMYGQFNRYKTRLF